ncbi:MAG: hypothetical protein Q7T87_15200 [Polaromonas sp.]|nr:hypothetical protein [Polaromonas sp.]
MACTFQKKMQHTLQGLRQLVAETGRLALAGAFRKGLHDAV